MRSALCLLMLTCAAIAAEPRDVTRAKAAYLKTVNRAEDQLIEQLEDAAAAVAKEGEIELAIEIRDEVHRLKFGEWVPAIEGPGPESLQSARRQFMEAAEAARDALATAMEAGVKELGADGELTEARQMADRIVELKSGRWEPSRVDTFPVGRFTFAAAGSLISPVGDGPIPDELAVAASGRGAFRITGASKTDGIRVDGRRWAHFGKAVSLPRNSSGILRAAIPAKFDTVTYFAGFVQDGREVAKVQLAIPDRSILKWSFRTVRGSLRFELRRGDEVLAELSAPASRSTLPVFAATVRRPGDKADITIAVD